VDAPVSGGVGGAEKGTLTFMVGGQDKHFEESKQVLSAMGSNIVHCGDVGTGEVAKLCNNMLLAISMSGVSEAMSLGELKCVCDTTTRLDGLSIYTVLMLDDVVLAMYHRKSESLALICSLGDWV
jgi:3-hydroxyisobutyrate dehydrogenase-like beta-hydroxyacid dehydrogenase